VFLLFPYIFGPKSLPKTLPKQGLDPLKIDDTNGLFFNFDFLGFWPRFGSLLGLQHGAKLALKAYFPNARRFPGTLEKPFRVNVSQKLHLGGLWARFWCPQALILKGLGSIFSIFSHDFGRVRRELAIEIFA
tara:strand:- start:587 stop:982 length:396 start_codon:yes stop_codon:yes gene_type:complete